MSSDARWVLSDTWWVLCDTYHSYDALPGFAILFSVNINTFADQISLTRKESLFYSALVIMAKEESDLINALVIEYLTEVTPGIAKDFLQV